MFVQCNRQIVRVIDRQCVLLAVTRTAKKFVVPKSFKACAFPMYKLGNAWEMNTCV